MGFNKRFISQNSIRLIAVSDDFEKFYNYFKSSDTIILNDKFSSKIYKQILLCTLLDKENIINIMNKCK